jgi:hypothetical protein
LGVRTAWSFIPLILLTGIWTVGRAVLALHAHRMPGESAALESVFQQLLLAMWVYLDRQGRQIKLPFEFDAFVFFAWPVALPYYLVKSRGARGLLFILLCFFLLVFPSLTSLLMPFDAYWLASPDPFRRVDKGWPGSRKREGRAPPLQRVVGPAIPSSGQA